MKDLHLTTFLFKNQNLNNNMEATLKTSIIIPKYRETGIRYTNYGKIFLVLFLKVLVL